MGFNCKSNILAENNKVHNPASQLGWAEELQKLLVSPLASLGFRTPQVWLRVSKLYSPHNPGSLSQAALPQVTDFPLKICMSGSEHTSQLRASASGLQNTKSLQPPHGYSPFLLYPSKARAEQTFIIQMLLSCSWVLFMTLVFKGYKRGESTRPYRSSTLTMYGPFVLCSSLLVAPVSS